MRINHNISALNTYRQLTANNTASSKSLEKLSSGMKINRAGDNAAGLAISEKMRGQIRGLDQATNNANDGISLIQTAEGGLNETHSILQRMRELAVQSANDTNTTDDRKEIQKEIEQLTKEINRISSDTEFNKKKLLDGSAGIKTTVTEMKVGTANIEWLSIVGGSGETKTGDVTIEGATAATNASYNVTLSGTNAGEHYITINGTDVKFTGSDAAATAATAAKTAIDAVAEKLGVKAEVTGDALTITSTSNTVGARDVLTIAADAGAVASAAVTSAEHLGTNASITEATIGTDYVADGNTITVTADEFKGLELKLHGDLMDAADGTNNDATFSIDSNDSMIFHIGANSGQNTTLSLRNMDAASLGVDALDLTTQAGADAAITTIDDAISNVSSQRAALGAMQNRLEHTINNLGTTAENLTASESQIRDVDMAKEMMEYTKNNILSQAAQSMLAQANQQPQNVLQLLQ